MTVSVQPSSSLARADALLADLFEEIANKLQAGEPVDLEAYVQKYPEHGEQLRRLLPAMHMLADLGRSAAQGEAAVTLRTPAADLERGVLGDFRIVREVGRGGMGIVYEAEQISLGRRVALKMLPFAAGLDARQLQRFKNEAHAAAQLHHTNIVPVYAIGCERGVHFYAMQFIDGQTLASSIRALRQQEDGSQEGSGASASPSPDRAGPSPAEATPPVAGLATERSTQRPEYFRTVAKVGVQAAEALEYAHGQGIVHRDIKPANLLVDVQGSLWITDFGLARCRGDQGLTMTGDLVGTLRYMSPEQAQGKQTGVDHRTDIYSLGVTLYELLTLRPAFAGDNREEVLRQITDAEPRPLRHWNSSLPADLETIVLKAMAKEPESRYATAQELADDLRCFLEHKPIRARRPSLWERGRKLARRHRAVVAALTGATALVAVILVLSLVISNLLISRERDRATANLQQALDLMDEIYQSVVREGRPRTVRESRKDQEQLQMLAEFYERFLKGNPADREVRFRAAKTSLDRGNILISLGELDKAIDADHRALTLLNGLVDEYPDEPDYRRNLAAVLHDLGRALTWKDQPAEALPVFRLAREQCDHLIRDFPDRPQYRSEWVMIQNGLSDALTQRPADQEAGYRQALDRCERLLQDFPEMVEYHRLLAKCLINLGGLLARRQQYAAAEGFYRRSLAELDKVPADSQKENNGERERGLALLAMGVLHHLRGQVTEARPYIERATALHRAKWEVEPLNPQTRRDFYDSTAAMIRLLRNFRDHAGMARAALDLPRAHPDNWEHCYLAAGALASCIRWAREDPHLSAEQRRQAVQTYAGQARDMVRDMRTRGGNTPEVQNTLAWFLATAPDPLRDAPQALALAEDAVRRGVPTQADLYWNTLGVAQYRMGHWPAAVEALEKSCRLRAGGSSHDFFFLAMAHWQLGDKPAARRWYDKGVQWMAENQPDDPQLFDFQAEAAALLGMPAPSTPAGQK
jgi:serine/threonine protein kinase